MDYRSYYGKIFSSLSGSEASLLERLVKDEKCSMKNSLEQGVGKEEFLKGFLSGPSLDKMEEVANRFKLVEAKDVEEAEHYIAFVSYLTLDCPAARAVQRMEEVEKKRKKEGPFYSAFTFHAVDKNDYVLLGFEDGLDS